MSRTVAERNRAAALALWLALGTASAVAQPLPAALASKAAACAACHGHDGHAAVAGVPHLVGSRASSSRTGS